MYLLQSGFNHHNQTVMKKNNLPLFFTSLLMKTGFCIALILLGTVAFGQISITPIVTDAGCSSNGSIKIEVAGGSDNYSYQITGSCLNPPPPPQNSPVFNNLPPCDYTVMVIDSETGETVQQNVTVSGNYQAPSITAECGGCSVTANVDGGAGPFAYSISTEGLNGPYQSNSPPDNPVFDNISLGSDYWVQVMDACGNVDVVQCNGSGDEIYDISITRTSAGNIVVYNVDGGSGDYTYTINSTVGIFTNTTGIFPPDQWGCGISTTVSDGCTSYTEGYDIIPQLNGFCINFADGMAQMEVVAAPPYTITVYTPTGTITSNTNYITGLPINAAYYGFKITDGCGVTNSAYWQFYPNTPAFPLLPVSCQSTSLSMIAQEAPCGAGIGNGNIPVAVECLSCVDTPTLVINSTNDVITFYGNTIGDWEIAFEGECGDHFICKDTMVLWIDPFCDSLKAFLVDRFICDNGYSSDRMLLPDSAVFYLMNNAGGVIDSNHTGLFTDLASGMYSVKITHPVCGTFEESAIVGEEHPLNVQIVPRIRVRKINGSCIVTYDLYITANEGDLMLTGNGNSYLLDENDMTSNCLWYRVLYLLPGVYHLEALGFCGSRSIYLPEPEFDLQAVADGTCPGSGTITVSGTRTYGEWNAWKASTNPSIQFYWNGFRDNYSLDVAQGGDYTQTGQSYTFHNAPAGNHTVYLYALKNNTCPVDTAEVFVPEPDLPKLDFENGILCDGAGSTDLLARFSAGKPPYTLQEMDCYDLSVVLQTLVTTSDSIFKIENVTQGDHCYRLVDGCITSLDQQLSVLPFADEIRVGYNCDNTITLSVDSIQADYRWVNEAGEIVGMMRQLTIPNVDVPQIFTLSIDIGACVIEREIMVDPVQIIPEVAINGSTYLCEGMPLQLTANTDETDLLWNTGENTHQIEITEPGTYTVSVVNKHGCSVSDTLPVELIPIFTPVVLGDQIVCSGKPTWLWVEGVFDQINWSTGSQTDSAFVTTLGQFTVEVVDTFGCKWEVEAEITEHIPLLPTIIGDTLICENTQTLLALLLPYNEYRWSDGSTSPIMIAGEKGYAVTVTDSNGCTGTDSISIAEIPTIVVHLEGDTLVCEGEMVNLRIVVENLSNDLSIWWNNPFVPSPSIIKGDTVIAFTADQDLTIHSNEMSVAGYDCPFIFPDAVNIRTNRITEVSISAPTFTGFEISCHGDANGSAAAQVSGGIEPYGYNWSNQAKTKAIGNLGAGAYSVTVTDSLGCTSETNILLNQPGPITPVFQLQPPLCYGEDEGTAEVVQVNGGAGDMTGILNDVSQQAFPADFVNMPPGHYQLEIVDENGCTYDTAFYFPQPLELLVELGEDLYIQLGDEVIPNPLLNFEPEEVLWSPDKWVSDPQELSPVIQPLTNMEYLLEAWNEHGCYASDVMTILVDLNSAIYAPNAFSPNSDGTNDLFTLYAKQPGVTIIHSLLIFDRWGNKVFENYGFPPNQEQHGWDGYFYEKPMNPAVFAWTAKVGLLGGGEVQLFGDLHLIR